MSLHWCAWHRGCGNDDSNPTLRLLTLSRYSPNRHLFLQEADGWDGRRVGLDRLRPAECRSAKRAGVSCPRLWIAVSPIYTYSKRHLFRSRFRQGFQNPRLRFKDIFDRKARETPIKRFETRSLDRLQSSPTATGYPHTEICAACESVAQDDAHLQHLRYATDQATWTPPRPDPRRQC